MERYNIFNLIHKGLRASLYHTAIQLQQTDFSEQAETEEAVNRVREIIMLFEEHAHKEDRFILPVIRQFEPSVAAGFEDEHKKDEELGSQLQNSIRKTESAHTLLEKLEAGRNLIGSFEAFTLFNLQHMAKEEDLLNKILWRYYSDDEIKTISTSIAQSVAPWMQDFYTTWMLRGINSTEASNWIKSIKNGMPSIIFKTVLQKAEAEFSKHRFSKIIQPLNEEMALA